MKKKKESILRQKYALTSQTFNVSIYLSICLSIYLSISISIYLYIYTHVYALSWVSAVSRGLGVSLISPLRLDLPLICGHPSC